MAQLRIDETGIFLGEERISVLNPAPAPPEAEHPSPTLLQAGIEALGALNTLDVLVEVQTRLLARVAALETRIEALQQRTWWTMLKDWVKSWFGR